MSADAWKRLIVAVGGLFTAIFFAVTQRELDPVMTQKVIDAVVWIVGLYLAQSGARAVMKERNVPYKDAREVEEKRTAELKHLLTLNEQRQMATSPHKDDASQYASMKLTGLPFNPNATKPPESP